jgi:hypothetical protein
VRVARHEEPQRQRVAPARREADARAHPRPGRRRHAVVEDPDRPPHQVGAVVRAVEPERLPEAARAAQEIAVGAGPRPAGPHRVETPQGHGGAQQHRVGL